MMTAVRPDGNDFSVRCEGRFVPNTDRLPASDILRHAAQLSIDADVLTDEEFQVVDDALSVLVSFRHGEVWETDSESRHDQGIVNEARKIHVMPRFPTWS